MLVTGRENRFLRITRCFSVNSPSILSKSGLKGQPSSHAVCVDSASSNWPRNAGLLLPGQR